MVELSELCKLLVETVKQPIQEVQEVAEQMNTAWTSVQMHRWNPSNQPAMAKICRLSANTKPWWDQDLKAAAEWASEVRKEPRQHQELCIPRMGV